MHKRNIWISPEGLEVLIHNKANNIDGKDYLWTTNIDIELPILMDNSGPQSEPPTTISSLFLNSCEQFKTFPALLEYNKDTKLWSSLTYQDYLDASKNIANAIISLGIKSRSCIGILSYNCSKWFLAFYGTILADCVPAGLYMSNSPETCHQVLDDCKAPLIFVEDDIQLTKILKVWDKLPHLKYVVTFNKVTNVVNNPNILTFEEFLSIGVRSAIHNELELASRIDNQKPGKCAVLVYTSGTTGVGKGTMLSHDNCTMFLNYIKNFDIPPGSKIISYLPVSHIASMSLDIMTTVLKGWSVYFADKDALKGSLADYIKMVRPKIFLGVPRVYEKIQNKIEQKVKQSNILRKSIFNFARNQGDKEFRTVLQGIEPSWKYKLASKLVYNKIRKEVGFDETMIFLSGAAPLSEKTQKYFHDLGIFIINAYGLSETTGGISTLFPHELHEFQYNSCGKPLVGSEIIIGDEKELLFRSRTCFMGYLNKEEDTKNMIDNKRRVHSGDIGKFDEKNRLYIKGRIKELIVTAGGENVAPYPIESKIMEKLKGFASWVVVIGDNRKYLSLLVVIKNANDLMQKPGDELEADAIKALENLGINATTMKQLFEKENFAKLSKVIQNAINYANSYSVSNAAKIKRWIILPRDFSIATEELTPTLKLKRKKIEKHFKNDIDEIYNKPQL